MDKCSYCGAEIKAGQTQCPDCGASQSNTSTRTIKVENELIVEMHSTFRIGLTIAQHIIGFMLGVFLGPLIVIFPIAILMAIFSKGNNDSTSWDIIMGLTCILSIPAYYVLFFIKYKRIAELTKCFVYNDHIECNHTKPTKELLKIDIHKINQLNSKQTGLQKKYGIGTIIIGLKLDGVNRSVTLENIDDFEYSYKTLKEAVGAAHK